jgi:hypothetical protein
MTLESAIESALAPITEIMLDAETVQPLYVNHEEVNVPRPLICQPVLAEIIIGTLNSVVGYIICIHCVLFVHFS